MHVFANPVTFNVNDDSMKSEWRTKKPVGYYKKAPSGFGVRQLACFIEAMYQLPLLITTAS